MSQKKNHSSLALRIGKLWSSGEGTTEKFSLDVPVEFDPLDIVPASNLKADVMLVKLKDEISAIVENLSVKVRFTCQRCLKHFERTIKIRTAERQFMAKKPKHVEDFDDVFLIDTHAMTIDLHEMIRQEIILHFPLISVCSKSCKGLCETCGTDLNKKKCKCKKEDTSVQKPFKNLKELLS